ncbi:endoflagellar protein [Clostridium autoethanogenum]|uniref:Endoflagellar protein n=1 Tax=Clostridium autoethanogenum TaxID=84023 RepID=A0A3M0T0Y4_9CLOT|nr:flagellar FlbD family protein [Clostridium autoethanogenum]RMD04290.1 endoflagellar protein [Clostridium autoethanogenum]
MIKLTGLDNKEFIINADTIEKLEAIPESLITLTNGKKYLVKESNDEIVEKVIKYKRKIYTGNFQ